MPKAAVIYEYGPPEVFKIEDVEVGDPGPGEVRLRQTALGINFAEVRQRSGENYNFPINDPPIILGREAAGIVEKIGEGVTDLRVGDRVAYGLGGTGGYTQARLLAARYLINLPDSIDDRIAAAVMVRGLTAWYLIRRAYSVQPGDSILVHAAAGGVGLILTQWAKHIGAMVIGTVGSEPKAKIAQSFGCDHTINYSSENVSERVRELTGSEGVAAVYDSVGRDTFDASLDSLRPVGHLVTYGAASGQVDPIDPMVLMHKGSLHFTRTSMRHYTYERSELEAGTNELFDLLGAGIIRVKIHNSYPLSEISEAHRALESRQTTGSTIVVTE